MASLDVAAAEFPAPSGAAAAREPGLWRVPIVDELRVPSPRLAGKSCKRDGVTFVLLPPTDESRIERDRAKN
jgi:hypothetical protein